jgi:hypothetical protein
MIVLELYYNKIQTMRVQVYINQFILRKYIKDIFGNIKKLQMKII